MKLFAWIYVLAVVFCLPVMKGKSAAIHLTIAVLLGLFYLGGFNYMLDQFGLLGDTFFGNSSKDIVGVWAENNDVSRLLFEKDGNIWFLDGGKKIEQCGALARYKHNGKKITIFHSDEGEEWESEMIVDKGVIEHNGKKLTKLENYPLENLVYKSNDFEETGQTNYGYANLDFGMSPELVKKRGYSIEYFSSHNTDSKIKFYSDNDMPAYPINSRTFAFFDNKLWCVIVAYDISSSEVAGAVIDGLDKKYKIRDKIQEISDYELQAKPNAKLLIEIKESTFNDEMSVTFRGLEMQNLLDRHIRNKTTNNLGF
jgi:hypothetical protein